MKAARLYGAHDVRLEDVATPDLRPGTALVRVRSVGLCGSDLHYFREGRIGNSLTEAPLVLGHEFAGEVVTLAPDAPGAPQGGGLRPGAAAAVDPAIPCGGCEQCLAGNPNLCPDVRFCGTPPTDGGLQEYITWPVHLLYPLPEGISYDVGALLEPLGVLIHACDLAKIKLADTVAVLGAGPIGLLAVTLAKLSGAAKVIATDVIPERIAAAQAFGADAAADARQVDLGRWIREQTSGRGVDVAIECAGAPETPGQAVDAVRAGGRVVLVGIPSDDRIDLAAAPARRKGVTIKLCRRMKHAYPRALALVRAGMVDLEHLATHHFPLDRTPEAFECLDRGEGGVLKAMVEVGT
ncbi:MAG: zinc-dependent alcohol dehydrogenase [Chloroflexota bacterium]